MHQETQQLITLLKQKRQREGYSLRKLSSIVGVSFSTLSRIERGDGEPDNNTRVRLLEWLGDDARKAGLNFENVASVHFRASKKVSSDVIQSLFEVADYVKKQKTSASSSLLSGVNLEEEEGVSQGVSLSKEEMEKLAEAFRSDLELQNDQALDPLLLKIEGIDIINLQDIKGIDSSIKANLLSGNIYAWSAMSIPLKGLDSEDWVVVFNNSQNIKRIRVSILEEIWHILLGHQLTKITKFSNVFGRTFSDSEEHDAYYLASATLLPREAMIKVVSSQSDIAKFASSYGVTKELAEYRIKRLGLWHHYKKREIKLAK